MHRRRLFCHPKAKPVKVLLPLLVVLVAAACGGGDSEGRGKPGGGETPLLERARSEGIRIGFANGRPYGFERTRSFLQAVLHR